MSRATIIIDGDTNRERASHWVSIAALGVIVEFKKPKRTLPQNARMWAMLTDIAEQMTWPPTNGIKLNTEDWKLVFLDALDREIRAVPNLDQNGFVNIGRSSSDLTKEEMSDLIELMLAFGAKHGVRFNDDAEKAA